MSSLRFSVTGLYSESQAFFSGVMRCCGTGMRLNSMRCPFCSYADSGANLGLRGAEPLGPACAAAAAAAGSSTPASMPSIPPASASNSAPAARLLTLGMAAGCCWARERLAASLGAAAAAGGGASGGAGGVRKREKTARAQAWAACSSLPRPNSGSARALALPSPRTSAQRIGAAACALRAARCSSPRRCRAIAMASSGPRLRFCPESNDLLYPKEDKERKVLVYFCRSCAYKEDADPSEWCVYRNEVHHTQKEKSIVLQVGRGGGGGMRGEGAGGAATRRPPPRRRGASGCGGGAGRRAAAAAAAAWPRTQHPPPPPPSTHARAGRAVRPHAAPHARRAVPAVQPRRGRFLLILHRGGHAALLHLHRVRVPLARRCLAAALPPPRSRSPRSRRRCCPPPRPLPLRPAAPPPSPL